MKCGEAGPSLPWGVDCDEGPRGGTTGAVGSVWVRSVGVRGDHLAAVAGPQAPVDVAGDAVLEEPNAAVGEERVDAAGMGAGAADREAAVGPAPGAAGA